jgi:hypothetical protein
MGLTQVPLRAIGVNELVLQAKGIHPATGLSSSGLCQHPLSKTAERAVLFQSDNLLKILENLAEALNVKWFERVGGINRHWLAASRLVAPGSFKAKLQDRAYTDDRPADTLLQKA